MIETILVVNVASLVLLVAGILLVARRNPRAGQVAVIGGMIFAVTGLISSIAAYQGWLPA